ncbi:MAG: hypothetical protein ACOCWQ_04635 [Nanoarchaeota archaeon]
MLGVATGSFYRCLDRGNALELIQEQDLPALELTLAQDWKYPINEWVRNRQYVSIHYPYIPLKDSEYVVQKVGELSDYVGADAVVVHPDQMEGYHGEVPFRMVTEMLCPGGTPLDEFGSFLDETGMDFVFDVGHAPLHDAYQMQDFFERYKGRICHAHVSAVGEGRPHCTIQEYGAPDALVWVAQLGVPLISECTFRGPEHLRLEIEVLREYEALSGIVER